jgi:hypothetical protein
VNYKKVAEEALMALPGKRGIDIPEEVFDKIHKHASAETLGVWGRHPTPHQLQALHDQGLHEPHQIKEAFGQMPHPHAEGISVADYTRWSSAKDSWDHHSKR